MNGSPVVITSMRLVKSDRRSDGSRLAATFDAEFPTFKLVGCLIVLDANDEPQAYTPEARSRTRDARPIMITDPYLRRVMQRKAVRLYDAIADEADAA